MFEFHFQCAEISEKSGYGLNYFGKQVLYTCMPAQLYIEKHDSQLMKVSQNLVVWEEIYVLKFLVRLQVKNAVK